MASGLPRLVTVWCPEWPVVAAGVDPARPAAVFVGNRVVACSPGARAAGVRHGDRRRQAQGSCPELVVLGADPAGEARAFEPVVRAVTDLAPRLELVEPGWLTIPARGPSRYFGGDAALAERLTALVAAITGGAVGVGVADGRTASAVAARLAADRGPVVVAPGDTPGFLDPLPIEWLREIGDADADLAALFGRLGLRTLGALAALDPGDVLGRFGATGLHAHRCASGVDVRPTVATDPVPEWYVEHVFAEPIEQRDAVTFTAKRLADDLVARLSAQGRVCVRLVIVLETEHGERCERVWYRDLGLTAIAMVERTRWQLDGWVGARHGAGEVLSRRVDSAHGPTGGVTLVRLVPDEVRGDDGMQTRLWGGRSRADDDAARAIVRLAGLAGEEAVLVPAWAGGRLPAERYRLVPAVAVDLDDPGPRLDRGEGPWPGSLPAPSPAIVHRDPLPVELVDAAGERVRVTGRGEVSAAPAELVTTTQRVRVVAWAGPWPVEQHWWHPSLGRRIARFQLVTAEGDAHLVGIERQVWTLLATYA